MLARSWACARREICTCSKAADRIRHRLAWVSVCFPDPSRVAVKSTVPIYPSARRKYIGQGMDALLVDLEICEEREDRAQFNRAR
jgi:hypothetical protein